MRWLISMLLLAELLDAQDSRGTDWSFYSGDAGGSKYSALKDINRENVTSLRPAWIFHTNDVSDGSR